jgi:hypothetical protein
MIPKEWLQTRMSDGEIAALGTAKGRITRRARPLLEELRRIKAKLKPGDELWYFDSPTECWQNLGGCRGMAIVRDGDIVDMLVLMEN